MSNENKQAVGNQFDPEQVKQDQETQKQLKKENLSAVFSQGKGRLSIIAVVVTFFAVFVYGLTQLMGGGGTVQSEAKGNDAMLGTPSNGDPRVASQEEANMRAAQNANQAGQAQQQGSPYLAPPILHSDASGVGGVVGTKNDLAPAVPTQSIPVVTTPTGTLPQSQPVAVAGQPQPQSQTPTQNGSGTSSVPDAAQLSRQQQLQLARDRVAPEVKPQILFAMGRDKDGQPRTGGYVSVQYGLPDRTKTESAAAAANSASSNGAGASQANSQSVANKKPLVDAGEMFYATLRFGANSDDGTRVAFATIHQGKLKGTTVIGKAENRGESYEFTFDKLSIPGYGVLAANAIAIDESTYRTALADDVDHHTLQRYGSVFLASALTGLGRAAQIVTGTTTVTGVGNTSVASTTVDPVSARQQTKIALGEVGTTIGEELKRQNSALKPTVVVNTNKGIGVVFISPVYEEKK